MTANPPTPRNAPNGLPWSLLMLTLPCPCGGTFDAVHDGGETGGAMIPDLALISEDGCTGCHRDLDVHEIAAINTTLYVYRRHGAWPAAWTTEKGGVLTLDMARYSATVQRARRSLLEAAQPPSWSRREERLELEPVPTRRLDVLGAPDTQGDF